MDIIDRCRPHIEAALEYAGGTHQVGDVIASILAGQLQLWPGEHSAVVTEIEHYPQMKTCHLFLGGGDLAEIRQMLPDIERWAHAKGCAKVTLAGRKGWTRALIPSGYEPSCYAMEKRLNGQGQQADHYAAE